MDLHSVFGGITDSETYTRLMGGLEDEGACDSRAEEDGEGGSESADGETGDAALYGSVACFGCSRGGTGTSTGCNASAARSDGAECASTVGRDGGERAACTRSDGGKDTSSARGDCGESTGGTRGDCGESAGRTRGDIAEDASDVARNCNTRTTNQQERCVTSVSGATTTPREA